MGHGWYPLHEHPWLATSWQMDVKTKLEGYPGVRKAKMHMCQFGMVSRTRSVGSALGPVLKPTGFPTNCPGIARELAEKCPRYLDHAHLVGGRAGGAATDPQDYAEPFVEDWLHNFVKTKRVEYGRRQ